MANPVKLHATKSNGEEVALRANDDGELELSAEINASLGDLETLTGALTETAPTTDTASSGLNGRLQRIAQHLTNILPSGAAASAITPAVTSSLATSKVIKASAGNLHGLNCAATTVAGMFLVHNTTAAPAAGSVTPIKVYPVGVGQAVDVSFDPPLRFSTGISVTFTSAATPFTQTDSATAFISGDAV